MHKKDIFMYAKLDVTYPSVLITSCDVYLILRRFDEKAIAILTQLFKEFEREFLAQHKHT